MLKLTVLIASLSFVYAEPCFLCLKPGFLIRSELKNRVSSNDGEQKNAISIGVNDVNSTFMTERNNFIIGRRQWLQHLGYSAALVNAAAAFGIDQSTKLSVCDPLVESYQKRTPLGTKIIHIVGTAHVSSASAALSGNLVKQAKPDGIFLELDTQRLNRAFRNGVVTKPMNVLFFVESNPDGGTVTLQSASLLPQKTETRSGLLYGFLNKITLKNPIQQMYEGLESQGITPGEEFITAVEEGANVGSVIILGDRRMDFTLRRLAKALILYTDPKKLAEADYKITSKMKEKMPELNEWEKQKKVLSAEEFQGFVEKMKTKESSTEFMGELRKAAPEFYSALVTERDVFMGRGIDALFSGERSFDTIVAVIGLGHIDGVGRELKSLGWTAYFPKCQ